MIRYHARWICPISSAPFSDGTVAVENGRIAYVGPRMHAPSEGDEHDLGDVILTPGLVNTHCHLELTAMRGFLDGLGFRDWILRLTSARRAVFTQEMMLDAARLGVVEGLQHGITTFADTGDSGAGFDALLELGARGICYREVFGPDPAQCEEAIAGLAAKVDEMQQRATDLVRVGVSPHAPYTVSDALFRATADLARARGLPLAVHIAEGALESDLVERGEGAFAEGLRSRGIAVAPRARTPVALMESLGVLGKESLLIHCVRVDAEDVAAIARHACAVAHCPASNARLGHGIAPLTQLLDAKIRVGLGSDSVASNDRMDLLDESRLAALFAGARERRHDALASDRALSLATIGGAQALGLDTTIGTLEVGKQADIAAFRVPEFRSPVHDPVSALIFAIAGQKADFVAVAGDVRVRAGRLVNADPALPGRVQACAELLQGWLAH
ncbi:MAG: amidohydrolase [Gemmatimonadetes bacterium]|jgi:cytosine/adenosine deaminase-related metal-dependent hydrolase|nr:amidohydrolase [Gemmatimonadota bacterium]